MIVCPKCQHQEYPGAIYCSECGSLLKEPSTTLVQPISEEQNAVLAEKARGAVSLPRLSQFPGASCSLHVLDTGQIIPLTGRNEFTLGRIAEGQNAFPDIDLTSYRAYEKGVSRLHATIQVGDQQVTVMDLNSVNGTRINGLKIAPQEPHPISHGDILTLGKMKIQLLVRRKESG